MFTIGDLVSVDNQAEFRNDVQLDAFDNGKQNLALLRSYLFSSATPTGPRSALKSISSVGLLQEVVDIFLDGRENRLVAIANYGHGKSHLALALANFFSRPHDSEEAKILQEKISNALNDPARAARLRDFKEGHGEFLVVRLRGDIMRSLREQFLNGLEHALNEHPATKGQKLPFWYDVAEHLLRDLGSEDRRTADAFLEPYHRDVGLLARQVRERRDVYDICVNLFSTLHGVRPDLGGAVSLSDAISWAARSFCGSGKPLGGMLILFDEFSAYIQRYAQRGAAGDLQDLLNGVDNQRGKAVFLAFGQHDPLTVADNAQVQGHVRDSLKRELTRLPRKYVLYSLMESVIDAYLHQSAGQWQAFTHKNKIDTSLFVANDVAYDYFKNWYGHELHWAFDKMRQTVTDGCFPLHPLTTAFLCNVKLQTADEVGTPRTVLGFVFEELNARKDEPALIADRINWVLPVDLVDYFEARLAGEELYRTYRECPSRCGAIGPTRATSDSEGHDVAGNR